MAALFFFSWPAFFTTLAVLAVPLVVPGGWPFPPWGVIFRVTMGLHVIWMVNSLTHF